MRKPADLSGLPASSLSWIFRSRCAACGEPVASGPPFCTACSPALAENLVCCPRCAEQLSGASAPAAVCRRCLARPLVLSKIVAPWQYSGSLAQAIVRLKFHGHPEVARALAPLIAPVLVATATATEATMIVPVPLHWTRRLHRGFDQTRQLLRHANALSASPVPVVTALRCVRATDYQSRIDDVDARFHNVAGALRVVLRARQQLTGARVIIFDDLVATGATMTAAALALIHAGASQVVGVALARESAPEPLIARGEMEGREDAARGTIRERDPLVMLRCAPSWAAVVSQHERRCSRAARLTGLHEAASRSPR